MQAETAHNSATAPPSPPQLTPTGRLPNTPLANPRHEALAHAFVQGKTGRDAGLAAGFKDGPGLKGNVARLRTHNAPLRERIAEIAVHSAELAEIYDGWVLADVKMFAKGSIARLVKRDAGGKLVLMNGVPQLDFSKATDEDLRVIQKIKHTKYGVEVELRDPVNALEKLMRHRGLLRDKLALTDPSGVNAAWFVIADRPMTEAEWERQRASVTGE